MNLLGAWLEHAPSPMATVEGAKHLVRYSNLSFCQLIGRSKKDIIEKPFCTVLPNNPECSALLDEVYRTGRFGILHKQEHGNLGTVFSSFVMWPIKAGVRTSGVVLQATEAAPLHARTLAMNEALLLGSLRQHELTTRADEANIILQAEITRRVHSERNALMLTEKLSEANAALTVLATTDALTGLANRRRFEDRMTTEWQRALRQDSSLAVILIDVDFFKGYNDHFGHMAGDECLRLVAAAINADRRQVDVAARIGGDEFGLLMADTNAERAAVVANRVRFAVERLGLEYPLNHAGVVTITLGLAAGLPAQWGDPRRLHSAADQALYEAKARGRNRVHTATGQPLP